MMLNQIVSILTAIVLVLTITNACSRTGEAINEVTGEKYTTKGGIVFGNRKDTVNVEVEVDSIFQQSDSIFVDTIKL